MSVTLLHHFLTTLEAEVYKARISEFIPLLVEESRLNPIDNHFLLYFHPLLCFFLSIIIFVLVSTIELPTYER
jgi:hypothetical protein